MPRFRTRDRVTETALDTDGAPLIRCIGCTDDIPIVPGVNVFPTAVRDLVQNLRPRTTGAVQVVWTAPDPASSSPLRIEAEREDDRGDSQLRDTLREQIRNQLSIPADITLVPPGSLERSEMKSRLVRLAVEH